MSSKKLSHIDLSTLYKMGGDDSEFIRDILQMIKVSTPVFVVNTYASFRVKDYQSIINHSRKYKSVVDIIDNVRFTELFHLIKDSIDNHRFDELEPMIDEIIQLAQCIMADVDFILEERVKIAA